LTAEEKHLFQLFLGKAVRKVPTFPTNGLGICPRIARLESLALLSLHRFELTFFLTWA